MRTDLDMLVGLPRGDLLAMARAALIRQAAEIYAPEALEVVQALFYQNTETMGEEQLAHIVLRAERPS